MKCISPLYVKPNIVPCGRCNFCRQLRSMDWSFRLAIENRYASSAYFVTLTLRYKPQLGVWKRHLQLYFKRLRSRNEGSKIVYFAVAEYGERTKRPHYHAIIFNANEDTIHQSWKLGHVHCGAVSDESIAYVSNYSLKGSEYPVGMRKPFALMSRRPAIGAQYLQTHTSWHRNGEDISPIADPSYYKSYAIRNGKRVHLPRFYRDKIFSRKEKEALTKLAMKNMDEAFNREVRRLVYEYGYTEVEAYNQIYERHIYKNFTLLKQAVRNESI